MTLRDLIFLAVFCIATWGIGEELRALRKAVEGLWTWRASVERGRV